MEKYELNFVGKQKAKEISKIPTDKKLVLDNNVSTNLTSDNMIIVGDNLDALKLLKQNYENKIKMIYIDPPYNTGNNFIYNDKFYNNKNDKHSNWLSFMCSRLLLARDLLSDDGVIFISIDNKEQANLKLLCDEIFREENFIGEFIWIRKKKGAFLSKKIRKMTEYILCYQKLDTDKILVGEQAYTDKQQPIVNRTNSKKELLFPKNIIETKLDDGLYDPMISDAETGVTFKNKFEVKNGIVITELKTEARYVWSQEFLDEEIKNGSKIYLSKQFGFNVLRHNQAEKTKSPSTLIDKNVNVGTNEDASSEIAVIFKTEVGAMFDYAKPTSLVKYLTSLITFDDDIILDFFAGSGTTGQAVMELNAEDGGNRKFILVQIDEPIKQDKPAYQFCKENNLPPVISSITIERLRRAGEKIKREIEEENNKKGLFEDNKKKIPDIGFKVYESERKI